MRPGTSALVVMVELRWLDAVQRALDELQPAVVRQALPDAVVARRLAAAPDERGADDRDGSDG